MGLFCRHERHVSFRILHQASLRPGGLPFFANRSGSWFPATRGFRAILVLTIAGLLLGVARAADDDKKADENAPAPARKPAVKVFVLKGTYADNPSGPEFDPMSMLTGGMEKPGSFYELCEKIDAAARDRPVQYVFLDLSAPTSPDESRAAGRMSGHIRKLRDAKQERPSPGWKTRTPCITPSPAPATRS